MKELYTQPALLTRTEIGRLLGNVKVAKQYQYRIKSDIKKKIKPFTELELPLIMKRRIIETLDLSKYTQNLRTNPQINNQKFSINTSNTGTCAQNMVCRKGCVPISVLK